MSPSSVILHENIFFTPLAIPAMQQLNKLGIFTAVLLVFLIVSCRKKFEPAAWDVDLMAPLAEGRLQIQDLADQEELSVDSRRLFHILFEEEVFNIGLDSLIGIPDTSIVSDYPLPIGGFYIFGGQPFEQEVKDTKYDLKDVKLLEAIVRESEIELKITNTLNARMLINYQITSATKDGVVFEIEEFIDPKSEFTNSYTLDGYTLDLRGSDKDDYNSLATELIIMLDPADSAYLVKAGDRFLLENTFKNVVPEYARGYFGSQRFEFDDKTIVEGFEQIPAGRINFTEFDVSLVIENAIGADLGLTINELGSSNLSDGSTATLSHPVVDDDLFVGRSTFIDFQNVKRITKTIDFNEDNSNLDALFELRPDQFNYNLDVQINPLGNVSLGNDFVLYGKNLKADLFVDVPLTVGLNGFTLVDTVEFDFERNGDNDPVNQINSGFIYVYADNHYPLEAELQLYMLDEWGATIDSLFAEAQVVESAPLNTNGRVVEAKRSKLELPVDQSRLDRFEQTRNLLLQARLNTTEADSVSIYSVDYLDVKVVGEFNARTR